LSSKKTDSEISDLGEEGWIRLIRKLVPQSSSRVLIGLGDDASLTRIKSPLISTTDLLIEDVHFIRELHPPRLLGRKALSVNLSDVAAMAGIPRFALLSLGIPPELKRKELEEFLKGFLGQAKRFAVELIGGDTTAAEKMTISVTVLAEVAKARVTLRSGARDSDAVYVTGHLGDASLGLHILRQGKKPITRAPGYPYGTLIRRHLDPAPRLELARDLSRIAHAMIDLSDGLVSDLGHILEETGLRRGRTLSAEIETSRIPLSSAFRKYFKLTSRKPLPDPALRFALQGGEDYELLFTAPSSARVRESLSELARKHGIPITRIGVLHRSKTFFIRLFDPFKKELVLPEPIFEHFSKSRSPRKPEP
jgi:thiamine-monophosphate kinase